MKVAKHNKSEPPWDINNPESYGAHFGPYDENKFKLSRRIMFRAGITFIMNPLILFYRLSRLGFIGKNIEEALIGGDKTIIYAHWHRFAQFYFFYAMNKRHALMASHKDGGEFGARCLERVGILSVRGAPKKIKRSGKVSDKKGKDALSAMSRLMREEKFHTALTVDGSHGPAFRLKLGALTLAQDTGSPILVMSVAARPRFFIPTWDRMWCPLPWSKIIYFLTGPFYIPKNARGEELEEIRRGLEQHMVVVKEHAQKYFSDEKIRGLYPEPVWLKPKK